MSDQLNICTKVTSYKIHTLVDELEMMKMKHPIALSKADYLLPHKSKQKNMLKFSNEGLEHANFLLMRRQFLDRLFQVEITSTMGAQYILFAQWSMEF